ncbi:unnamed protein product [Phytophthora lilii]|uniref:Unnamed protein product n=1 Tax=Phytophthora lilii TaxID=2077276 RepID=A0A9W6WMR6_9STRA|nr:unnamed protein product [Phytophthora lilii]
MAAPTLNEFEEIMNRARVHSSFLNPGGKLDMSHDATYVVRTMKPLEVFGDVGLLLEEQQRTASVVATETTLLMQIDRDTFMALRACNLSRELRYVLRPFRKNILKANRCCTIASEKMTFLAGVACLDHWEDEAILRLCDRMEKTQHTYNDVVVVEGEPAISSPSATLYRLDRVDFRQIMLKDATTEQMLRQEVIGLSARANTTTVMQDLRKESKWNQYKHELVNSVLTRHKEEHIPIMGPRPDLAGHRTAREPNLCLPMLPHSPTSNRGALTERGVPGVSSGQLRRAQKPQLDKPKRRSRENDGSWLSVRTSCTEIICMWLPHVIFLVCVRFQWARHRAGSNDITSPGGRGNTDNKNEQVTDAISEPSRQLNGDNETNAKRVTGCRR